MDVAQKVPDQVQHIIFNWLLASIKEFKVFSTYSEKFPKFDALYTSSNSNVVVPLMLY